MFFQSLQKFVCISFWQSSYPIADPLQDDGTADRKKAGILGLNWIFKTIKVNTNVTQNEISNIHETIIKWENGEVWTVLYFLRCSPSSASCSFLSYFNILQKIKQSLDWSAFLMKLLEKCRRWKGSDEHLCRKHDIVVHLSSRVDNRATDLNGVPLSWDERLGGERSVVCWVDGYSQMEWYKVYQTLF